MDNPIAPPAVPPMPPKQPEIFVEQQLIVIALRRKMFMEKQAVIKKELKEGWHVKDIKLGVGKMGTNGFMSILLEREYGLTVPTHADGTPFYTWHESTETHYRDPHGLGEPDGDYTIEDGEEIGDDQPYTFNDDGPDNSPDDTEDNNDYEEPTGFENR